MIYSNEKAVLAGGCFWGMEDLFRAQKGVVTTRVGYVGGTTPDPTYAEVKVGATGHAEAIEIIYDPRQTSYREILRFFFKIHDPTTLDRQGNDRGTQYRSAIFPQDETQRAVALDLMSKIENAGIFNAPLVTKLETAAAFHAAEDYHQDYLVKNPGGYTCHFIRKDLNIPD